MGMDMVNTIIHRMDMDIIPNIIPLMDKVIMDLINKVNMDLITNLVSSPVDMDTAMVKITSSLVDMATVADIWADIMVEVMEVMVEGMVVMVEVMVVMVVMVVMEVMEVSVLMPNKLMPNKLMLLNHKKYLK